MIEKMFAVGKFYDRTQLTWLSWVEKSESDTIEIAKTVRTTKWNWNKTVLKQFWNCLKTVLFQFQRPTLGRQVPVVHVVVELSDVIGS